LENNELIIAISPHSISKRIFIAKNRPVYWVYFGKNYLSKVKLQNKLNDNFSELDISRSLEEVANEIRSEHVKWIEGINQKYGFELEWWFGNISSRNIYSSDLFQYCCYLVLLERLWGSQTKKPSLIVVESLGLALAIHDWAQKKKIRISIKGQYKLFSKKIIKYGKFCMRWLDFIITTVMRKTASVVLKKNDIIKKSHNCEMVMISTFVHDSSISNTGVFNDRYLPYLHEYLEMNNKLVLIHPVFHGFRYNFFPIFQRISRSASNFIIQEKYLTMQDYIRAWIYPIQLLKQKIGVSNFHGFDLTEIICEDQREVDVQNVLQAILTFRLMQRLEMNELKLHSFIVWYENQALDRAIVAGVRNAFPKIKIIGAQIFLYFPNFLRTSPTQSEIKAGIVPHILLTTSRYQCGLARAFAPGLHCIPAAALRYAHVFNEENYNRDVIVSQQKFILVLTSFNHDETIELLLMTQEIMKSLRKDVNVHVQFHPDIRINEIIKRLPEIQMDGRFKIYHGSLSDGIRVASVVVSKGTGAIVEAIAKGTPAIFVGNQNKLNLNPMSGISTPLFTECYSTDEVLAALTKYLNLSDIERNEYRNLGKSIRDLFFLPVDEDTLAPFLAS
jgi:hypothetical protein